MPLQLLRVENLKYYTSNHVHPSSSSPCPSSKIEQEESGCSSRSLADTDNVGAGIAGRIVNKNNRSETTIIDDPGLLEADNSNTIVVSSHKYAICPVCILPFILAFIIVFTIGQLIIIHRTIESYKAREQAYADCYYPKSTDEESHHHQHVFPVVPASVSVGKLPGIELIHHKSNNST